MKSLNDKIVWQGIADKNFESHLLVALEQLDKFFLSQKLVTNSDQYFIEKIIHFESKDLFDDELKLLSKGQIKD